MKNNSIKTYKTRIFIILFFLFLAVKTSSQPPPPGGGDTNDEVPISSFIAIGLLAGAAYGIRKSK